MSINSPGGSPALENVTDEMDLTNMQIQIDDQLYDIQSMQTDNRFMGCDLPEIEPYVPSGFVDETCAPNLNIIKNDLEQNIKNVRSSNKKSTDHNQTNHGNTTPKNTLRNDNQRIDTTKENNQQKEINLFSPFAKGPYQVYVQKKDIDQSTLTPLNVGKILNNKKIKGIKLIKKIGRKRIAVEFETGQDANNFTKQVEHEMKDYAAFIPSHLVTCEGLIRVDKDMDEEEILNNLKTRQNNVKRVRRLNKRNKESETIEYIPTVWVIVTFEGTILPKYVSIYEVRLEVNLYVKNIVICNNCFKFGHIGKNCNSRQKCRKCGEISHKLEECTEGNQKCANCKGEHSPLDPKCAEHIKQKRIKELMATYNISFFEAMEKMDPNKKSNETQSENREYSNIRKNPMEFPELKNRKENNKDFISNNEEVVSPPTKISKNFSFAKATQKSKNQHNYENRYNFNRETLSCFNAPLQNLLPLRPIINSSKLINKDEIKRKNPYPNNRSQMKRGYMDTNLAETRNDNKESHSSDKLEISIDNIIHTLKKYESPSYYYSTKLKQLKEQIKEYFKNYGSESESEQSEY